MAIASLGKFAVGFGIFLIIFGLILIFGGRIPFFGRLPGDLLIQKEGLTIYIPFTTLIIISLLLTIVMNISFRR